jgi:hypothetical protein
MKNYPTASSNRAARPPASVHSVGALAEILRRAIVTPFSHYVTEL